MKKHILFVASVALSLIATSCSKSAKDLELSNAQDSISYAVAVGNGIQINEQYLDGDSTGENLDAFMKGLEEAFNSKDSTIKYYMMGLNIGANINEALKADSGQMFNPEVFKTALYAAIQKKEVSMTQEQADSVCQILMPRQQEKAMDKKYGVYKKQQEAFLRQNAKRQGVTTTASGLQYEVIKESKGRKATGNEIAVVNYKGQLTDGTVFDSSEAHGDKPVEFPIQNVIKGWSEALQLMPIGSKWKLYIPSELAYGAREMGNIKPFSTLIFEVELVDLKAAPQTPMQN